MEGILDWARGVLGGVGSLSGIDVGVPAITIALGTVLLLAGRKIYPILLGVVGFGIGWWLVPQLGLPTETRFPYELDQVGWIGAALIGVVCAALTFFVHKIVLGLVGFLTGAFVGIWAIQVWGVHFGGLEWLVVLLLGVFAALALRALFGGALVVLSSIVGALLIAEGLAVRSEIALPVSLALVLIGVFVQSRSGKKTSRRERRKHSRSNERRLKKMLEES